MGCKKCRCSYCRQYIDKADEQYRIIQIAIETGNHLQCAEHSAYSRTIIGKWAGVYKSKNAFDKKFSQQFLTAIDYYNKHNEKMKTYHENFGFVTITELRRKKDLLVEELFSWIKKRRVIKADEFWWLVRQL